MSSGEVIDYREPGVFTAIDDELIASLVALPEGAIDVCRFAQALMISPMLAIGLGLDEERQAEKSIRPASQILRAVLALGGSPLDETRPLEHRVVGTCRHFAVLSCAFLQFRGYAARARCGFATYFSPGDSLDHWVTEYWRDSEARWVRVDSEWLGLDVAAPVEDLEGSDFLSGGEAWIRCREGSADPARFGVFGVPEAWGIGEVRGNAVRDLAALNKVEMLPWDQWGRMEASYEGETGPEYDDLMDTIATVTASNHEPAIHDLYRSDDLSVPGALIG